MSGIKISVVAPMHNEEGNVVPLYEDISRVLTRLEQPYEIIFVNDLSADGTLASMKTIQNRDPHFHFVDLETNVGENWALLAGVSKARGEVLVTIDGDYQNDPAYIPALLEELSNGYRVVSGRRRQRVDKLWSRLLPSQIANGLIRFVSGVPVHDCGCGLKAYRREVLDGKFVPEGFMNRFSPAALGVRPHEFAEVEVVDRPRISGQSHYGLNRVFFVLRDLAALPFAVRGPARWIGRFRLLKWFSLAVAVLLAITGRWGLGAAALLLALIAFSNVWNLDRFIRAQTDPEFRIKEYR
ncbi:MAG TPA: glycosyltransferase family 2 protein [Candidatus Binatia bacterium]